MRIALVFTPLLLTRNWTALKAQDLHNGVIPPISLGYVAAIARAAGHECTIIDAAAEHLSFDEVADRVRSFRADLLGFTMATYGLPQTLSAIKELKAKTGLPVLVGGWHLGLYPRETLGHTEIDFAVVGEGELTIPHLLQALEGGSPLKGIPGIAYQDPDTREVVVNRPRERNFDLDSVPFPARDLLDNCLYHNILTRERNFTAVVTARGCPYRCSFCDLKSVPYRARSPENLVDEIEQCYHDHGIREIDFYDSTFTVDPKRVDRICDELVRRKLKVRWTVRTRADCVSRDILRTMRRAGCAVVMYGIESADRSILRSMHKDVSHEHIIDMVAETRRLGMLSLGFFIVGAPGDTVRSVRRTIDFACRLPLDYVQFTKMVPFPQTEIYQLYVRTFGEDYWADFTADPSVERELPLVGTSITPGEAQRLQREAYLRFYFRPSYVARALGRIGSVMELKNSIHAAWTMLATRQHLEG